MSNGPEHYEDPENCAAIQDGIAQTGFPLEHSVVELLRDHRWTVISNRYYLDDIQPAVREIDMVAYKVSNVRDFSVISTLLVSCKKSATNTWALLSRDADKTDPNTDWTPIHVWSSCLESEYLLKETPWKEHYVWAALRSRARGLVAPPDARIFAFQEMSHPAGKPQNDRAIFQSITSLLKALGYELAALPSRVRDRRIYQFNLLSIVDAPALLRLHFGSDGVDVMPRSDDVYLADYIVNRERLSARIHFIHASALAGAIEQYDSLHEMHGQFFAREYSYFYRNVLRERKARSLFMEKFSTRTWYRIRRSLPDKSKPGFQRQLIDAYFDDDDKMVKIEAGLEAADVAALNADSALGDVVREALKTVFHYEGEHAFVENLVPF